MDYGKTSKRYMFMRRDKSEDGETFRLILSLLGLASAFFLPVPFAIVIVGASVFLSVYSGIRLFKSSYSFTVIGFSESHGSHKSTHIDRKLTLEISLGCFNIRERAEKVLSQKFSGLCDEDITVDYVVLANRSKSHRNLKSMDRAKFNTILQGHQMSSDEYPDVLTSGKVRISGSPQEQFRNSETDMDFLKLLVDCGNGYELWPSKAIGSLQEQKRQQLQFMKRMCSDNAVAETVVLKYQMLLNGEKDPLYSGELEYTKPDTECPALRKTKHEWWRTFFTDADNGIKLAVFRCTRCDDIKVSMLFPRPVKLDDEWGFAKEKAEYYQISEFSDLDELDAKLEETLDNMITKYQIPVSEL